MICPVCDEEIEDKDRYFQVAVDVPYVNIRLHRNCYINLRERLGDKKIPQEIVEKGIKLQEKSVIISKNRKKLV